MKRRDDQYAGSICAEEFPKKRDDQCAGSICGSCIDGGGRYSQQTHGFRRRDDAPGSAGAAVKRLCVVRWSNARWDSVSPGSSSTAGRHKVKADETRTCKEDV